MKNRSYFVVILSLLFGFQANATIRLPHFFADNMVLQQKSEVRIWGTAREGGTVKVRPSWDNRLYKAIASREGKWQISIKTPSAGGPYQISFDDGEKLLLKNVLIGEVWLCSGQSNMDMPVLGYKNQPVSEANDILMDADNSRIRLFHVEKNTAGLPLTDCSGSWEPSTSATVKDFSAVGYLFAKLLQQKLKVPVGVIQSTWGGSPVQAWMGVDILKSVEGDEAFRDKSVTKAVHQTPGNLFNAMIAPLLGIRIAGVLWYQGEQNRYNPDLYRKMLPVMVRSWREAWNSGEWPFYYVQIAPMSYPKEQKELVPLLREAQMQAADSIPNSGMIVTLDAGDEKSIHPPNKTVVAKRLAYWALAKVYDKKGLAFMGPVYKTMKINNESIELSFDNAPNGLTSFGKELSLFEISGEDKVFHPAKAYYISSGISVHSDLVKEPKAVRYAFKDWVTGELFNTEGIPASSFRTDNW